MCSSSPTARSWSAATARCPWTWRPGRSAWAPTPCGPISTRTARGRCSRSCAPPAPRRRARARPTTSTATSRPATSSTGPDKIAPAGGFMRFATHCLAVLTLAGAVPALADDLTILTRVTRGDEPATTATSYVTSDRVRVVQADGREFMADLKNGEITMMDGKKKQYFVITRQDMNDLKARIEQQTSSPEMQRAQ